MPRSRISIHTEHLIELKRFIQLRYGKSIDSLIDCEQLAEAIHSTTKKTISKDTLRRVFRLISTVSKPSVFTLDTLSQYAGFDNYSSFCQSYQNGQKQYLSSQVFLANTTKSGASEILLLLSRLTADNDAYNALQQLMLTAYHQRDELFFKRLFSLTNFFQWNDENKYGIFHTVQLLGILCKSEQWLQQIARTHYVGLPFEIDYFAEWVVDYDEPYYDVLLDSYFKKHYNNPEKALFYHTLKLLISYKKNEFDTVNYHYRHLPELPDIHKVNNILWSRIIGSHYLYFFINDQIEKWQTFHRTIVTLNWKEFFNDSGDRLTSLLFVCEYLYLQKKYASIIELTSLHMPISAPDFSIWSNKNFSILNVYVASSYLELNDLKRAKEAFSNVNHLFFSLKQEVTLSNIYEELKRNIIG